MKLGSYMLSIVLLLLLPAMTAIAENDLPSVQWADGLLTVQATDSRLSSVLQEIERQTGITIRGVVDLPEKVSMEIFKLPLDAALRRLLAQRGYAFMYRGSILAEVWLMPEGAWAARPATARRVPTGTDRLEVEDALWRTALDPDPNISQTAYDLLLNQNRKKAMEVISAASRSDNPNVRFNALQALVSLDDPNAISSMGSGITDSDPGVRMYAVQALAEKKGSEALNYLEQALYDEDPTLRIMALTALESHGSSGLQIVRQALADQDEAVRAVAADLLNQNL